MHISKWMHKVTNALAQTKLSILVSFFPLNQSTCSCHSFVFILNPLFCLRVPNPLHLTLLMISNLNLAVRNAEMIACMKLSSYSGNWPLYTDFIIELKKTFLCAELHSRHKTARHFFWISSTYTEPLDMKTCSQRAKIIVCAKKMNWPSISQGKQS